MSEEKELTESLGTRMKSYEDSTNVPNTQSFLIRADGNCFSKFTKGLRKPFDDVFCRAMIKTANDVLDHFSASCVYVCSDEITLFFDKKYSDTDPPELKKSTHIYSGRYQKISSLVAAKCSVSFNKHMLDEVLNVQEADNHFTYSETFITKIKAQQAIFDGRLIPIPEDKEIEVVNNLIWRSCYDCHRNTVSTYGREILGRKKTFKKKSNEMIESMEKTMNTGEEKDWAWNSSYVPMYHRYGCFGKKILVEHKRDDGTVYHRSKILNYTFKLLDFEPSKVLKVLRAKYWDNDFLIDPKVENVVLKNEFDMLEYIE